MSRNEPQICMIFQGNWDAWPLEVSGKLEGRMTSLSLLTDCTLALSLLNSVSAEGVLPEGCGDPAHSEPYSYQPSQLQHL